MVRNRGDGGYVDWSHLVDFVANAERQRLERLPIKLSNKQEITMTQNKQNKDANKATTDLRRKNRLGHWVRVAVSLLSFGFIFPHAFTEDDDIAK